MCVCLCVCMCVCVCVRVSHTNLSSHRIMRSSIVMDY